jgi:hypothetical protein
MSCRIDQTLCKTPEEEKLRGFDYTKFLANVWTASSVYLAGEVVRPPKATGFQYRALNDGQTRASAPTFPTTDGATKTDGTVVWQAEPIDNDSLRSTIAASVWNADDSSITFADQAIDNTAGRQRTSVIIGGGVPGATHTVINTTTMSDGSTEEMGIAVEISALDV